MVEWGMQEKTGLQTLLDQEGRLLRWPKKNAEKLAALEYLQGKFERNRRYSESEVNRLLQAWHVFGDHALLRRELYNRCLIERTPDCREY